MSACRTIIHGWFRPFLYFAKPAFSEIVCGKIHSLPRTIKSLSSFAKVNAILQNLMQTLAFTFATSSKCVL